MKRFGVASLLTHGLVVGAMAWMLAHDGGRVDGAPGLAGNARTRIDVTVETIRAVKESRTTPPPPVAPPSATEGLPVNVKSVAKEIDTPPTPEPAEPAARSAGDSETAPAGAPGQSGSGTEAAAKLGDSDRTNRLGLYLQKMQRKIQGNLGPAGYLPFPTRARLTLELRKDGSVAKITVAESSGDAALDRLAVRAVQKSNPFDPWDGDQRIEVPVRFQ